jgi:hypothetical protein
MLDFMSLMQISMRMFFLMTTELEQEMKKYSWFFDGVSTTKKK